VKTILCSAFVTAILLTGCGEGSTTTSQVSAVDYSIIDSGDYPINALYSNRKIEVFHDQDSLDQSLAAYTSYIFESTIDFASKQVILFNMGTRTNGGFNISIESIEDNRDYLNVKVLLEEPGSNCGTAQVITSPYLFIEVNSTVEVTFEEKFIKVNCD